MAIKKVLNFSFSLTKSAFFAILLNMTDTGAKSPMKVLLTLKGLLVLKGLLALKDLPALKDILALKGTYYGSDPSSNPSNL